jgi:hypothetical protein
MSRKARRAFRAVASAYLREDPLGVVDPAAEWLKSQPGFEDIPLSLRRRVVIDLRSRDGCVFEPYRGEGGEPDGMRLVCPSGAPLSQFSLLAALLRARTKGL